MLAAQPTLAPVKENTPEASAKAASMPLAKRLVRASSSKRMENSAAVRPRPRHLKPADSAPAFLGGADDSWGALEALLHGDCPQEEASSDDATSSAASRLALKRSSSGTPAPSRRRPWSGRFSGVKRSRAAEEATRPAPAQRSRRSIGKRLSAALRRGRARAGSTPAERPCTRADSDLRWRVEITAALAAAAALTPAARDSLSQLQLEDLLQSAEVTACFEAFLRLEFATENLNAYRECRAFRENFEAEGAAQRARRVFDKYLGPGAPQWVCCPNQLEHRVQSLLALEAPKADLFVEVERSIHRDMQMDLLPRFLAALYPDSECAAARLRDLFAASDASDRRGWALESVYEHLRRRAVDRAAV